MKHNELREKALGSKTVRTAFAEIEPEYSLLRRMLIARKRAGLTQADIAKKMGTKSPAIARLESSLSSGMHSPSVHTLTKYAMAVNCRLEIKLVFSK